MTIQDTMFPELAEAKRLERAIAEKHNDCKRKLAKLPEYAKFVKLFGEYTTVLDGAQTDEADKLIFDNVEYAIKQAEKLLASLVETRDELKEASDMLDDLNIVNRQIELHNSNAFKKNPPSENYQEEI